MRPSILSLILVLGLLPLVGCSCHDRRTGSEDVLPEDEEPDEYDDDDAEEDEDPDESGD